MSDVVTLTPAARPRKPLPVSAVVILAAAIFGDLIFPQEPLEVPIVIASIIGSVWLAIWLEGRIFVAVSRFPAFVHFMFTLFLAPAGLFAGMIGGVLVSAITSAENSFAGVMIGGMWFCSAAAGTAVVQFVDLFGRVFASRFSTRIVLTVFGLIVTATITSVTIVIAIPRIVNTAMEHKPDSFQIRLDDDKPPMSGSEFEEFVKNKGLPEFLHGFDAKTLIGWALVSGLFVLLIPGLISAASKLGELAMERVHPLDLALERVAKGDLQVRVEEAGSTEFVRLAAQFNRMVGALDIAQKMERAFGAYVSKPVIDRIRAQHGAIALPSMQKDATVFFADVRGFTSMSENLPPDKVLEVLNRYYGHAVAIVEQYEGYLDKFIGDAMYVVFNGPIDQPDHVARGVRCALALQEKILILNTSGEFPETGRLEVGIGVATGPVVAGNVGTERSTQFSVVGDTVNLASRLCAHAPPGDIWISARTKAALPGDMRAVALEPIAVKGKGRLVEVHRLYAASAPKSASNGEASDITPRPVLATEDPARVIAEERFLEAIKDCEERGLIHRPAARIIERHVLRLGQRGMNPANTGNLQDLFVHTLSETRDVVRAFAQVLADSIKVVPPADDAKLDPPLKKISDGTRYTRAKDLPLEPLDRMLVSHTALVYADKEMRASATAMLAAISPELTGKELDRELHRMILQSQHMPSSAYVLARAHGFALDVRETAKKAGHTDAEAENIQIFFDISAEFRPEWLAIFRAGQTPDDRNYLDWREKYRGARKLLPEPLVYQLYTDTLTNFGAATMASGKWVDALVSSGEVATIDDVPAALAKIVRGYQIEWTELHERELGAFNAAAAPNLEPFGLHFDEQGAPVASKERPSAWNELVVQHARAKRFSPGV